MATGWHAAVSAGVGPGMTIAVVGDGAVGLSGVLAASQLGADRVIAMSRHEQRQQLAKEFGGGPAPVRNYLPDLADRVWNGRIEPGKVFDLELPLDQVAEAYRAMDERRAIKVLLRP